MAWSSRFVAAQLTRDGRAWLVMSWGGTRGANGARGRDRNAQEVQDSKAKWDRRTQGQKSATFASEVPPNEVVGGAVAARIKAYSSESQHSSSRGWRIGDAFQEKAAGRIHTYRLIAIKPHVTRAGYPSVVLYWSGRCAACGSPLVALSGKKPRELVRTCLEHRGKWKWAASAEGAANG